MTGNPTRPLGWLDSWSVRLKAMVAAAVVGAAGVGASTVGVVTVGAGAVLSFGSLLFNIVMAALVWRSSRANQRTQKARMQAHEARMQVLEAEKQDLVGQIITRSAGVEALAQAGICRYCGFFSTHHWSQGVAILTDTERALLVRHEAQCERRPADG